MSQSLCVELLERSYDSSMGQAGIASVERRIAAGHLPDITVSATNRDGEKETNV